ncbi:MAG: ATP-grasp domain-containing protein, partial [Leucobacter sp.]|nr:ATP-grasp domain-containing protein [Leucobacter sp.]
MTTLLVANRGEIAVRIIRTARDMGIRTVSVFPADDAGSLHVRLADHAVELQGLGPSAYLNAAHIVSAAVESGVDLVHPGYGFLAESPDFARACAAAGLTFLGPSPEALERAGAKTETQALARALGIPLPQATGVLESADPALELLTEYPDGIALKAVAGGGGRGISLVSDASEVPAALARCQAEALHGFGDARVFAERLIPSARHIEVQGIGGADGVRIVGDRDCSLQRRRQKVIEIAPAPGLDPKLRRELHDAARSILTSLDYESLATVEFLVSGTEWVLLEINPRIQVEHTVTESVTGLDLVACQIGLGLGRSLSDLGIHEDIPLPVAGESGSSIQLRISAETIDEHGTPHPAVGTIRNLDLPTGRGVRIDTWVQSGSQVGALYDTLIAKLIIDGPDLQAAARRAAAAVAEFSCSGIATNASFVQAILDLADLGSVDTRWIDEHLAEILSAAGNVSRETFSSGDSADGAEGSVPQRVAAALPELGPGEELVLAPLSGTIVSLESAHGELGLIEAMKMHHSIPAPPHSAARALVTVGTTVTAGQPLFVIEPHAEVRTDTSTTPAAVHPGVAEVKERHEAALDSARPEAVAKVHARGRRTARENLTDLLVPGSFVEYGPLVIAAQTARRSVTDLIANTSGDGLIGGVGLVKTPDGPRRAVVMSYDYMVLAGTQGARNH